MYFLGIALVLALYIAMSLFGWRPAAVNEVVLAILVIPRLHDINRTGWWFLLLLGLEGLLIFVLLTQPEMLFWAEPAFLATVCLLLLGLGLIPGDPFENRFGPPPDPGLSFKRR